jgi:hypothetical protein
MPLMMRPSRPLIAATLVASLVTTAVPGRARADEKETCVAASDQAQNLRDEGKYRRAREALLICARDACPGIVRRDCEKWLSDLDASYPTIVLGARDAKGRDVPGARVLVDGAPFSDKLDGKPLPIDPGEHVFRYEAPGVAPLEERAVIRVGEKNRFLTAQLKPLAGAAVAANAPPPASSASTPSARAPSDAGASDTASTGGPPASVYILGGVGLVGLAGFAYFGVSGKSQISDMKATCAPACAQSDVDDAKSKLLIADVSLGVGLVAIGAATWILISHWSSSAPPAAARVDVHPLPGGALASVRGTLPF